jgi:5,10-methylenetetrahydromethanopterin reductase
MTPELSLGLFPVPGIVGTMAAELEGAGWDGLFMTDTQNLTAEVYASLGVAAASTERVLLGTGVTNPVTRHPAVTASSIATVHTASGGRAVLGIGRGDSSLGFLGRKPAPVDVLEEYLVRVRGYLHGEEVDLGDAVSHNVWIPETGLPPVPIDVAATGPRVIAVAARRADRVTFAVGADPQRIRSSIAIVRAERASAGLDPAGISIGAYVNVAVHPDVAVARELVRGVTAVFAHFSSMAGAPAGADGDGVVFDHIDEQYDMGEHGRSDALHATSIPDEFIDSFAVVGPAERCVARLSELIEAGVERIVVVPGLHGPIIGDLAESMRAMATDVLPALR